jgi:hypothetical protein
MTTDAREISQAELNSLFAIRDSLDAENKSLRRLLAIALPHVEASAGAEHLLDGFRPRRRPLDATVEAIREALSHPVAEKEST